MTCFVFRPIPEHSKLLNNYHSYIEFIHYVSYYSRSCAVYYHPHRCSFLYSSFVFHTYVCSVVLLLSLTLLFSMQLNSKGYR